VETALRPLVAEHQRQEGAVLDARYIITTVYSFSCDRFNFSLALRSRIKCPYELALRCCKPLLVNWFISLSKLYSMTVLKTGRPNTAAKDRHILLLADYYDRSYIQNPLKTNQMG